MYRGDTLALVVRSIAEGAKLTVGDNRLGHPRFVRYRPRSDGAAPHMRQNGAPATNTERRRSAVTGAGMDHDVVLSMLTTGVEVVDE